MIIRRPCGRVFRLGALEDCGQAARGLRTVGVVGPKSAPKQRLQTRERFSVRYYFLRMRHEKCSGRSSHAAQGDRVERRDND